MDDTMHPLPEPRAFTSAQLQADSSWIQPLAAAEIDGIERALRVAQGRNLPLLAMAPEDFPLDAAAHAALRRAIAKTQSDYGLCLLRGLPVERWSADEARLVFWGLGLHTGVARTQGKSSQYMSDVRNEGGEYRGKNGRGYDTNASLDFHCDFCDLVGLLCLNAAKSGGTSLITSSIAVHDEIQRTRPDLLEVLYQPFYYSLQGAGAPGDRPYFTCPIYGIRDARFASRCNRKNVIAAQNAFPEIPRLTPRQVEALDTFDALIADPRFCFSMALQRGDIQLLNNHVTLHSRTAFVDHDDPAKRRHLLRLWLALPEGQPLPEGWREGYKEVAPRAVRGGLRGSAITPEFLAYERRLAQSHGMMLAAQ